MQLVATENGEDTQPLYWAFRGVWPKRDCDNAEWGPGIDRDRAGTPLAGGYFLITWGLLGDLQYLQQALGFPNHLANEPCPHCNADMGAKPWTDCSATAAWIPTSWSLRSTDDWRAAYPDRNVLMHLPGLTTLAYMPDVMHCKHLGTDKEFYGSVLQLLCFHTVAGDPEGILIQVHKHVTDYYKVGFSLPHPQRKVITRNMRKHVGMSALAH